MTPADRAIVAAAEERDRKQIGLVQAAGDRHELLRIVREQEHLLRERADQAEAAAEAEFLRPIGPGR